MEENREGGGSRSKHSKQVHVGFLPVSFKRQTLDRNERAAAKEIRVTDTAAKKGTKG